MFVKLTPTARAALVIAATAFVLLVLIPALKWLQFAAVAGPAYYAAYGGFAFFVAATALGLPCFLALRGSGIRIVAPYLVAGPLAVVIATIAFLYSMHVADRTATVAPGLQDFLTVLPRLVRITLEDPKLLVLGSLVIGAGCGTAFWMLFARVRGLSTGPDRAI